MTTESTWKDQELHGTPTPVVRVAFAILLLLCGYGILVAMGIPQGWTRQANEKHEQHEQEAVPTEEPEAPTIESVEPTDSMGDFRHLPHYAVAPFTTLLFSTLEFTEETDEAKQADEHVPTLTESKKNLHPPYWTVTPFVLLLVAIAIFPLIPATEHWWHHNRNKFYVAGTLGAITLIYYGYFSNFTLEGHWPAHYEVSASASVFEKMSAIFGSAIIAEFIPFIVLLFALYVIAGGIRIEGDFKATPLVNSMILFVGACLASFIGTTGAAMLLIRLLIDTNRERQYKVHTVIFFIFTVCNTGGCLTPLGDPPLFLGFLRGVDFFWTLYLFPYWFIVNGFLILLYFLWDTFWFYPKDLRETEDPDSIELNTKELKFMAVNAMTTDTPEKVRFTITGLKVNLPLLIGVILAVACLSPTKPVPLVGGFFFPENDGHPWFFLREAIQLGLAALSLLFSRRWIRRANAFGFGAIIEVAALFFGIFICMQAPLQILSEEGENIVVFAEERTGLSRPQILFWTTTSLSCWLDNAPTYVVFFEVAKSLQARTEKELLDQRDEDGSPKWHHESKLLVSHEWVSKDGKTQLIPVTGGFIDHFHLIAIALGTVFIGGITYIANGPNFMVKAIAEQSRIKMPSFFGYMMYSCLILLPLYVVLTILML